MKKTIAVLIFVGLLLSVLNIGTTASAIVPSFSSPTSGLLDPIGVDGGSTTITTNSAPVALDDSVSTNEDTSKTIYVLSNDYDNNGDTLSLVSVTNSPSHGTAKISGSTIIYKPSANYYGSDSFVYKISDGQGSYDIATVRITVNSVNDPPVANAGGPYSAEVNEQITFSGSKSSDIDGSITGYIWDFNNDGTWDTGWLTTSSTTFTYTSAGTYTSKLRVKDNNGATKIATSSVAISESTTSSNPSDSTDSSEGAFFYDPVTDDDGSSDSGLDSTEGQDGGDLVFNDDDDNDNPPIFSDEEQEADVDIITPTTFRADAGKPYYGTIGTAVQFDASDSINAISYTWDFGDGTTGIGKTPTHTYSESGEYYAILTATNNVGSKLMDIAPVYISQSGSHLKPYGKLSYSADVFESITFDASESTSTDSSKPIVSYKWYFGDGSTATGQQVTHSYSVSKIYLVTLEVTDSQGNKQQDVLHVDIGQGFRDIDDFFILSDLADAVSSLIDLYDYLDVSIYTNFNGVEKSTPVRAGTLPVSIDMNDDGLNDVSIGSISLLKTSISKSQFHDFPWFVFTTTLSSVSFLSGGSISQSDEVTVCLQMSLDKISNLDLAEKRVRVGYYSDAGEAKPSGSFGIKHLFRPFLLLRTWKESHDLYPEVGSSITGSGGANTFSLFTNFADVNNPSIQSTMALHYDPFIDSTLIHRRGKTSDGLRLYDIAFQGSGQSAVKLYFTRETADGKASVGALIDPIQNFAFHVDATPLATGGGSITFRSEELIDNIVLFAESDDPQADEDLYFYLKNLPQSVDVEWDPSLKDGFIRASNVQGNERLEVGICNDLQDPTWKINATNLPTSVDLSWDLSIAGQIQLKTTNTDTIALDYYGWSQDQIINFHVDSESSIDVIAAWDLNERWFKLIKSDTLINFAFSIIQSDLSVDLSGKLAIMQVGDGLTIDFDDFENGFITVNNDIAGVDVSVGVTVKYGSLEVGVESLSLGASGGGSAVISWDDTPRFKVEADLGGPTYLKMSNFKLLFNNLDMTIGTLDLYGPGYAEIQWNEDAQTVGIGASAHLTSTGIGLDYEGLNLDIGSFELGGAASASIDIGEGFSVNAGARIDMSNFDLGVGDLDLSIGSLYLAGSGSVSVKKGSLESLELQGSTTFGIGSVNFDYNALSIKIQGKLDISAGGKVVLDKSHLSLQGTLTVTIPSQCTFIVNSETVKVQGTFIPTSKGSLHISWGSSNAINLGATVSTTINNFYFGYQTLKASSDKINLKGNGDVNINLGDTFSASGTISGGFSMSSVVFTVGNDNPRLELTKINLGASGTVTVTSGSTLKVQGDIAFYLEDFYFKSSDMEVRVDGVVDLDAGGYVEVGDNKFEMSVSGAVGLGCTFHFNQKKIAVSGDFNLAGDGTVALEWDTSQKYVELAATGGKLTADGLSFDYDSGAFIVTANRIEFAVGGHCLVSWANDGLKVDGGGGAYLKIKDITVEAGSNNIQIIGSLDLDANGYVLVADNKLELQVDGSISLGSCQFVINGESITAGGDFNLQGSSGKILLTWSSNNVELDIPSGNAPLSVSNLNFVYDPFSISGTGISFQAGGRFYAEWNTATNSIKIEGSGSADLSLNNVHLKYGSQLDVEIGSLSLDAGGYAKFEEGLLELRATGSMNLDTEFKLGGENIKAKGDFNLHGVTGTIQLKWDNNFIELATPESGVALTVTNLDFSYSDLTMTASTIDAKANGKFRVEWNTALNSIKIEGGSADLSISNVHIKYGTQIDLEIGALSLDAGGYAKFQDELLEIKVDGSIDLDLDFTLSGDNIKAKGNFNLGGLTGTIQLKWDNNYVELDVPESGVSLSVTGLDFSYGTDFSISSDSISFAANGKFRVDWSTASSSLDVTGGSASLDVTNVDISYGSALDIAIQGSLSLQAGGSVHFESNQLSFSGSTSVSLTGTTFTINSNSIYAKGSFNLNGGAGTIDISWTGNNVEIDVSGGGSLSLDITSMELEYGDFNIKANKINIGVGAEFKVQWDSTQKTLQITGGSGSLSIKNVDITYGASLDIDIDGTLGIQAGGNVFFEDGLLRLSGSANFDLIGTKITINGEWIKAEGTFSLSASAGVIEFTWDAENVGLKVTGGASLTITNPYLETQKIIVDANAASLGVNGNLDIDVVKASKIFDISGNVDFSLTSAIVKYEGTQIFSSSLVDISGGGTVHVGDTYSLQLSGSADIDNFDFNPPVAWSWPLDYVQGSFDLTGSGTLSAGQGTFSTDATLQGTIDQFKLYFTNSHMKFTKLTADANVLLDLTESRFEVKGGGQITLNSFNAEFDQWTASIAKAQGDGYLYVNLYSTSFRIAGNGKFILDRIDVSRGSTLKFSVSYLQSDSGGHCNVDLSGKSVDIHGNGKTYISLLSATSSTGLNVAVPLMDLAGNGKLDASWTSSSLDMDASVDINFRLDINTASYGDWYVNGNLDGAINLDSSWTSGESGNAKLTITRAGSMGGLIVVHDDLTMALGSLNLKTGSMTFTWDRGDTGYVQIQNTISATLSSFSLTKGSTFSANIGSLQLNSGTGRISWSKTGKEIEILNGILSVKPLSVSLNLGDVDASISLGEIKESSQPITINWFTDATGICGGGVDTNNQELAGLINFRIEQGTKGVRVIIGGLKTNDFEMRKSGGQWQFSGAIQIASSATVGLKYSGSWHDVVLSWDMQSSTKYIRMQCSFGQDVPVRLYSFDVNDWTFSATAVIDANAYMKLEWHFSTTTNHIRFDTAGKPMATVTFEATTSGMGVRVTASTLKASNAAVTWYNFPPSGVTWSGTIDFGTLTDVKAKYGSTWYDIY